VPTAPTRQRDLPAIGSEAPPASVAQVDEFGTSAGAELELHDAGAELRDAGAELRDAGAELDDFGRRRPFRGARRGGWPSRRARRRDITQLADRVA